MDSTTIIIVVVTVGVIILLAVACGIARAPNRVRVVCCSRGALPDKAPGASPDKAGSDTVSQ